MENELYHYGRKNMKWGQHIFCGPNCSIHGKNKEVFRERARVKAEAKATKKAESEAKAKAKAEVKAKKKAESEAKAKAKVEAEAKKKADAEKETLEQKKERVLKSRSAKDLYENAHLFTDSELKTAYNRLSLEKDIKSLIPKEVKKGKEAVDNAASWTKSLQDLTTNTTNLYNNVAKVYNSIPALNQGRDKLPIISDKSDNKKKDDK